MATIHESQASRIDDTLVLKPVDVGATSVVVNPASVSVVNNLDDADVADAIGSSAIRNDPNLCGCPRPNSIP